MPPKLWEIVEDPGFAIELEAIDPNVRRTDEFLRGATWVLARNPREGIRITDAPPVWILSVRPSLTFPPMILYYTFDDAKIYLLGIEKVAVELANED